MLEEKISSKKGITHLKNSSAINNISTEEIKIQKKQYRYLTLKQHKKSMTCLGHFIVEHNI